MLQTSPLKLDQGQSLAPTAGASDYDLVRRAVAFISEHWRGQPEVEEIAEAVGVTPTDLHHLFRRWAGLTPKAFVAALTLDHARRLLRDFSERARRVLRSRAFRTRPPA